MPKMYEIEIEPNEAQIAQWSKENRFNGNPPAVLRIKVPDTVVDSEGNVKDVNFIEKAANDYINARYPEAKVPLKVPPSLEARGDFLEDKSRGFIQSFKDALTGPPRSIYNYFAEPGLQDTPMGRPILPPAPQDLAGITLGSAPYLALGSPKVRAGIRGAARGVAEGTYQPSRWSGMGVTGGLLGMLSDPGHYASWAKGSLIGAGAGVGIDAIKNAYQGARAASRNIPLIGPRVEATDVYGNPLTTVEYAPERNAFSFRDRWSRDLPPGPIRMGDPYAENIGVYPPGTEPEFAGPTIPRALPAGVGARSGQAIITPEPYTPSPNEFLYTGPKMLPPGVGSRSGQAIPLPAIGEIPPKVQINAPAPAAPKPAAISAEQMMRRYKKPEPEIKKYEPKAKADNPYDAAITPSQVVSFANKRTYINADALQREFGVSLEKAKELIVGLESKGDLAREGIAWKRVKPNKPIKQEPLSSMTDRRILELQDKEKLTGSEASELSKLLKDRGDIKEPTTTAKEAEKINTITSPETATEPSYISHEELYKLAEALGVKATPLARALISKGYKVQESKFAGNYGTTKIGKKDWPENLNEKMLNKLLSLLEKVPEE